MMARGRKTGGRQKGTLNKATLLRLEALRAAVEAAKTKAELPMVPPVYVTGREYLESIINSPSPDIDARLRVTAAAVLARLEARPPTDPAHTDQALIDCEWQ